MAGWHYSLLTVARRMPSAAVGALWLWFAPAHAAQNDAATAPVPPVPTVAVDLFFQPGCDECARVRREVLPELQMRFGRLYRLREWDVNVPANYTRLRALMAACGLDDNARVYAFVAGRKAFSGADAIAAGLSAAVENAWAEGLTEAPEPPLAAAPASDAARIRNLARRFTLPGVLLAGLADSVNPCAISTLVFLMSVLAMASNPARSLIRVGAAYCAGAFLTYFLIGLGLLQALKALEWFPAVRRYADAVLVAVLALLAVMSAVDAWRYRRSGDARDVILRLPDGLKRRMHGLMRTALGPRAGIATGLFAGAAVTVLESVCTGQAYLPALAFIVRSGADRWRGLAYLAAYNVMFIVPLVVVLVLTVQGMRWSRLADWSRRETAAAKWLMAGVFAALAVTVLLMR
jgi:cytochrome c biogenesis protein CcdA